MPTEIITGRRNWDAVSMADYQQDMRESSDRAVAIIKQLRTERDQAQRALALAVLAAGGRIDISRHALHARQSITLEQVTDQAHDTIVLTTRA